MAVFLSDRAADLRYAGHARSECNSTFRHDFPDLAKEFDIPMNFKIYGVGEYMSANRDLNVDDL